MQPEDLINRYNVSRETLDRLVAYHTLLLKWQRAINLVSNKTLEEAWERHFADSLQLLPHIPSNAIVADLGSGAGFPGLVLAMARPDITMHLIESDARKGEFLRNVSRETKAPVMVHTTRIESTIQTLRPHIITARALAPIADILKYCTPIFEGRPKFILLKGQAAPQEIADARATYDFDETLNPSQTDPSGHVVIMQNVQQKILP